MRNWQKDFLVLGFKTLEQVNVFRWVEARAWALRG